MANADTPHGFTCFGPILATHPYSVDASNGTAFFIGDAVEIETDGNVIPATATGTQILGAQDGILAASTAGTVNVHNDPDQVYYAQGQSGQTPTQAMIGANTDLVAGAGNTNTNISGHELNLSDADTATFQFRIMDLLQRVDNTLAANAELVCNINEHSFKTTTGV